MRFLLLIICLGLVKLSKAAKKMPIDSLYQIAVNLSEQELDTMKQLAFVLKQDYASNPNAIIFHHRVMGIYYDTKLKQDSARFHFMRGIELADKQQNLDVLSALYTDIALIYSREKAYDVAKSYYHKAIRICLQIHQQKRLATSYSNLGVVLRKQKLYQEALNYYNLALSINRELKNRKSEANTLNNLGALNLEIGRFEEARKQFTESIALRIKNGDSRSLLFEMYANLVGIAVRTHNKASFQQYLDSVKTLAIEFPDPTRTLAIQKLMSGYYEEMEDWKNAFESLRLQQKLEDSIVNVETANTMTEMMEKYQSEKKEKENLQLSSDLEQQKLRSRNWVWATLGLSGFLLLGFVLLQQRNRKNKLLEIKNAEIKKQNQRLSELNHEKNALLGIVSHDLSAPFASIRLWNTVLESNEAHDEESRKAILRIQQATESGERMIKNILDVERVFNKEEHVLELEPLHLHPLIVQVVQQFEKQLEEKKLSVSYTSEEDILLLSDRNYLQRIFQNLFSNAIKYSYSGKTIHWRLEAKSDHLHFMIQDEGIGIDATELPFLFTKYRNLGNAPTAGEKSYGLGLNITKRLLEELGGTIEVQSKKQEGTTVIIKFPR